jgi:flagellar FliL protein
MATAPQKTKNDADNAEAADAGSKKKKKLLLIIGLAVALVAVSIGGTVFALKMLSPAPAATAEKAAETEKEEPPLAPAIYFEMTPNFTINFNVNGRQRYLQAAITLLYRDPTLEELLKLHMPAIRNGLVMLLSGKSFEELQTNDGKETLKAEALEIINNQLKKEQEALVKKEEGEDAEEGEEKKLPGVEQVLFTNFVMQ